jgi:EmrB/QacA subfamily drug resistance transporter
MPRLAPREVVFVAMVLAIFMVSVEATIVATAMPTIVADLGGLRYFSWVFGAYLLTQAVCIPIYGRLADFFGRKRLLMIAIAVFLTGSILSGFARSMLQLIVFRALQGIGGGGVQPVATTIVGDMYSGRERTRVQAILSSTWAFAAVIGPLLGAFLIGHVGWQSIFWINVPVGIACVAIMLRAFHENITRVAHRIDYLGSLLLAGGVGTLMYVLVMLGNMPAATAIGLGVAALALLAALLVHERRTAEPMMPLFLYKIRLIAIANAGNFAIGAMLMGISAFLPTFVQGAMNQSAVAAGSVLGSIFVGWMCGSIGGARLMLRTSYRFTALSGALPMIGGSVLLATLTANSSLAQAFSGVTIMGFGIGLINSVFVISTQAAVGWELRGAATSSNIFLRQIGQAIGSAAFGAVFNIGIYTRIPNAGAVLARVMDPNVHGTIAPLELARDSNAIAISLHVVYVILTVLTLVEFGITLALPPKLRPEHALPSVTPPPAHGVRPA